MEDAKGHLTVLEVQERLRAAGYTDSLDTIRRAIDRGVYGRRGTDWYRTESGYRMVRPTAVDALIERRRAGADAEAIDTPGSPDV